MPDLVAMIEAMPADERRGALKVLDTLSRPLAPREIEAALRARGCSKSQACKLANAVRLLRIVAIVGGEQ